MLIDAGILAIIRLREREPADEILHALVDAGVRSVEITIPTPGSTAAVERWRGATLAKIGMGTIRTPDEARAAADAGAQFLVTPTMSPAVLETAAELGLSVVCGALTPTEIDSAARHGAALVKVFPVDAVGGVEYLRSVAAPLNDIGFVATGGVDPAGAEEYARFGAAGVGIGSNLVSEADIAERAWLSIQQRGVHFVEAWARGLAGRG